MLFKWALTIATLKIWVEINGDDIITKCLNKPITGLVNIFTILKIN